MKKILLVLVLAAAAAAVWFLRRGASPDDEKEVQPVARVETAPLRMQEIAGTVEAYGVVEGAPIAVTLGYDCLVKAAVPPPGARLAKGDVILKVEPAPDARLALDSARSAAALAAKALAGTRERYDLKLATGQDLLAAEQANDDAALKLRSYEARGMGGDGTVAAPDAGVLVKFDMQAGGFVPAGTPLAILASENDVHAHLGVEAADAGRVRPGQKVRVAAVDRPDAPAADASVLLVGGGVDATTGAVDVRVPLPSGAAWLPGEHVVGEIEVERRTALVAPRTAVLPDEDRQVLYTVSGGKAVRHEVRIGIASGDLVEVSAPGLKAGDEVVTVGNRELEDGMAVRTGPAEEAKP
jgi:RND family efflux transporter MFP subunit